MKTRTCLEPIATGAGLILLMVFGCTPRDKAVQAQVMPTPVRTVPGEPTVPTAKPPKAAPAVVIAPSAPAQASWMDIKDLTFERRGEFLAGASALEGVLEGQISGLNAKRAAMTAETKEWDFAMKELDASRSYLKSTIDEAGRATPEIWDQEKEKVGTAIQRVQDACDKVRTTTTS